jgi:hypothetical protein
MRFTLEAMHVTIQDRGRGTLREKLRERLELAAKLRCVEHGQPIMAVSIHGRENGWFDSTWTTCCEGLEKKARAIVKDRL